MSEHPRVVFEDGRKVVSVDSSRVIFLLVSDVGAEGVNAAVMRYRNRSDVVPVSFFFLAPVYRTTYCCLHLCFCSCFHLSFVLPCACMAFMLSLETATVL